jgi:hypothetical protein
VIDDLKALNATLSLGILDFSKPRAELVKRLNKAGVPVIAWILLPEEEGYWFNIDNHDKAAARYVDFKAWTTEHGLEWAGVGLDIEMDINECASPSSGGKTGPLPNGCSQNSSIKSGLPAHSGLSSPGRPDPCRWLPGGELSAPLITDERRARATVLQRALGLVDLASDREVLMLYSSFLRQGDAALWSYAPEADSVGVGSPAAGWTCLALSMPNPSPGMNLPVTCACA